MPEIKNLSKAAARIKKAIKNNERIVLYGDADLDGATSLIVLEEAIKNLGGEVSSRYFPDRESEGYGLSKQALSCLGKYAPALLITLDCGIGNFEELKSAKALGFETIVIDHHEILGKVPATSLVIDPKQEGDNYPFKSLSTAGIIYRLCKVLLKDKLSRALKQSFLELAALSILADMMPEEDYNKTLIEGGLKSLLSTFRPGLKVILEMAVKKEDSPRAASQRIVSILNITDVKNHLTTCYLLLTSPSEAQVKDLARELLLKFQEGRTVIKEIVQQVEANMVDDSAFIVFAGEPEWPQALTGSVASRICRREKKPTFIFKIGPRLSRGSVRTPRGVNSVEMLKSCEHLLEMYGGHPPASGFTVKNENIDKLRECLLRYFVLRSPAT